MKKIFTLFILLISTITFSQANSQNPIIDKGSCIDCIHGNDIFNKAVNNTNFNTSHGSPTYNTTNSSVWIWSYGNQGEGVFSSFNFKKGKAYCIEIEFKLSRQPNGGAINPNAAFLVRAANGLAHNPSALGAPIPSNTSENIFSYRYLGGGFNLNQKYIFRKDYTPTNNYSQIWFYPFSATVPQVNFQLFRVKITEKQPIARSKFKCSRGTIIKPSKYGPKEVTELCLLDDLLVDGSASTCEDDYFIHLSEFNLGSWTNGTILHQGWVSGQAPNNIKITDYIPRGYQLRPGKIYKFSLGVGYPWNATEMYFTIVCCDKPCVNEATQDDQSGDVLGNGGGVSNAGRPTIAIHPNPTEDKVTFDFSSFNSVEGIDLQISDDMGREMHRQKIDVKKYTMSVRKWDSGIYNCKFIIEGETYYSKIIKK